MHWGVGPSLMHQFSPTLFWEFTSLNRGWILLYHPRPPMLGAGSEASRPHGRNLSGDLTQKIRTKEVLCLSESLSFYSKSLTRGSFLFLIPPPSGLDYRGSHTPGGIKDFCGWLRRASLLRYAVVLYNSFPSASLWRVVCLWLFSSNPSLPQPPWNEPTALFWNEPKALFLVPALSPALWPAEGKEEGKGRKQTAKFDTTPLGNQTCASLVSESELPNCSTDWATGHGLVEGKQFVRV